MSKDKLVSLIIDYGQQCRLDGLSHNGIDSVDTNESFQRIELALQNFISTCSEDCNFIPIEESSYKYICYKCGFAT